MIYHVVVGDMAAPPLLEAISNEPEMAGDVVVLRDLLHLGPIKKEEGKSFSETRTEFWKRIVTENNEEVKVDDLERLLQISTQLNNNPDDVVWLWMAPWPADVCAYYWMLGYLSKHLERFHVLNLGGLPFLDEEGKVYFPTNMSEILPKELIKARRLARVVTPAELEVDGEEWNNLVEENAGIRLLEGGKKLFTKEASFFDAQLESFCSHQFQKAHRVVNQAMKKMNIPTGDLYLGWRLRKMIQNETLLGEGDMEKSLRDFSVKLPGGVPATETTETDQENVENA